MKKEMRYLVPGNYMADPAVHVFNDRVYIYPSRFREIIWQTLPYMFSTIEFISTPVTIGRAASEKTIMAITST